MAVQVVLASLETSELLSDGLDSNTFCASAGYCAWSARPLAVSSTFRKSGFFRRVGASLAPAIAFWKTAMSRATSGCFSVLAMSAVWFFSASCSAPSGSVVGAPLADRP